MPGPKIATIGAAYSANKGAASMMQALLDNLEVVDPTAEVIAVSTHASDDRETYRSAGIDMEVASQAPVEMAAVQVPLAVLAGLLRKMRLPYQFALRTPALKALHDADVVADLSGISFVDGRRFAVIVYNALVDWIPMLLGTPVVKCSQAMGPFSHPVNGVLARLTLPRLATVCPRGGVTESHVRGLRLTNIVPASDMAFAMDVPHEVRTEAQRMLESRGAGPYIIVSPSQVVATYCAKHGIAYPQLMAEFIEKVSVATDHTVVMIAHSAQQGREAGHMNDLPLCREIAERVTDRSRLIFFDEDLLPTTLRAIISCGEVVVTSRFHAMISALAEGVPPLVIGWSHKYEEVLAPFDLGHVAMTYDDLDNAESVVERTKALLGDRQRISAAIQRVLPGARESAITNLRVLKHVLQGARAKSKV